VESHREAALEALRESEERYRTLIENASDLVYRTDKAGHFTFINRAALTTTGYEERELIGKSYPTLIRPDMRNMAVKIFLHQIRKGTHNTYSEFPILTKDGREIWLGQNIQLIVEDGQVTGFQAVSRDITERKQAEASLKQALNWQQTIFEGSRDAIFISDQDSRFVAVNNAACDLTGYSREQLLKMRIPDIHDLPDLDAYKMYHQRIFGGEEILSEAKILRSDSAKIDIEFNNRCVSIAGKLYMHTTARNIDDRKQAEAEIKRQLAEKGILLKEVHHRIKNNIASIGGLISLHVQSTANPEAIAVLQDAIGRVNSMRILYDKLLLSEDYKDISVKNYLDDLIDTVIAIFPNQAKITLEKRIADFHLDSKRLFPLGIITNELLTNKMKYAFINRDTGLIKISLTNVDNHVTLTIQDNGIGLPTGFDINESKGFGLKLVKMLSQQLGGNFSIENQTGNRCMIEFNI
jgi:PAS domain S-box-containing protein